MIINKIKEFFFGKEEIMYPYDFAFVEFSDMGRRLGLKSDRNKVIIRWFINKYGNYEKKIYPHYSEARVHLLQTIHKIPVFDKTKEEVRFPVYSRTSPGEASYLQTR